MKTTTITTTLLHKTSLQDRLKNSSATCEDVKKNQLNEAGHPKNYYNCKKIKIKYHLRD